MIVAPRSPSRYNVRAMKGLCCAIVLAFGLNAMFLQEGTPQKPQEDSQSSVPAKPAAPLQAPKDASSKSQYGSPSSSGERAARFRSALNRGQAELMAHPVVAAVVLWIIGFSCFWAVLLLIYPLALLVPLRVCASVSEVTRYPPLAQLCASSVGSSAS